MSAQSKSLTLKPANQVHHLPFSQPISIRSILIKSSYLLLNDLHNLYFPPNVIRMIKLRTTEHVAHRRQKCMQSLVGKHEVKEPLGRPRHKQKENIKKCSPRNRKGKCELDLSSSG
jgi:hypothetical protein